MTIFVLDVASGVQTRVAGDPLYGPVPVLHHAWSPDSRLLAYTQNSATFTNRLFLYSVADGKSHPVTDGLADATSPVFDASGKYLYFLVSTDAGPVNDWFSQANADMRTVQQVYLAVLAKGVPSPLAKESDEEKAKEADEAGETPAADAKGGDKKAAAEDPKKEDPKKEEKKKPVEVKFDADGLSQRILVLPAKAGVYSDLAAGLANQLFYRRAASTDPDADAGVYRYDLEKRKEDTLHEKADALAVSGDSKRVLLRSKEDYYLADVADKLDLTKFKVDVSRIQVKVDPPAEWAQIFDEAWRINRDYFYDPGCQGADWPAMRKKYAAFLPDLATRNDLFRVIQWMLSELAVGHSYQGPGDSAFEAETIPGGLLGADYEVASGRYRIKKVFGGLNWSPDLRSPLTEPGVDVKAGEYLLAVEGQELRHPQNLYEPFERTANRIVEITVGPDADGTGSRTVKVVPLENERRAAQPRLGRGQPAGGCTEATQGRVAYVYVPNTAEAGHPTSSATSSRRPTARP